MARKKVTVVISQAPGKNPVKRHLEEEIATQLILSGVAEVSVVPHLYDLTADHTGMLWLKSLKGDLIVLGWLYPRAIRWVLDRNGVKGKEGDSRLNAADSDEDDEGEEGIPPEAPPADEGASRAIGALNVPDRTIFAIDLRTSPDAKTYLDEIERLSQVMTAPLVQLNGFGGIPVISSKSSGAPTNGVVTSGPSVFNGESAALASGSTDPTANGSGDVNADGPTVIPAEGIRRRWYPVIDYSRCTNCMECIDFCLFGVYGVDLLDRILVEQEDNCKKGCPACSRVCPANAIVFPEHKTPAIAGAAGGLVEDFKIDLSKLFGAPTALEMAVLERDVELVADGRSAVGASVGLPKRQAEASSKPRDDLDDLMDDLDALDV
ncbi:ATP-binding protein [Schlesneria sp. T3-172]|uniref:ATP-binding protein n=1 Tax=Schlesneria sphaerica TaxID=3373610 RepID=UPI0037C7E433